MHQEPEMVLHARIHGGAILFAARYPDDGGMPVGRQLGGKEIIAMPLGDGTRIPCQVARRYGIVIFRRGSGCDAAGRKR